MKRIILLFFIAIVISYLFYTNYVKESFIHNLENYRGNNNFEKYPPCYNLYQPVTEIYDILEKNKLIKESYILLNVYSMILCQEKYLKIKDCNDNQMIIQRIQNLKKLGFDKINNAQYTKYEAIVNSIISPENRLSLNSSFKVFLTGCTYLIEIELNNLKKFLDINDFNIIYELNKQFYKDHYEYIYSKC
jgi:hypothetical protein